MSLEPSEKALNTDTVLYTINLLSVLSANWKVPLAGCLDRDLSWRDRRRDSIEDREERDRDIMERQMDR